jgi:hypothetical protein
LSSLTTKSRVLSQAIRCVIWSIQDSIRPGFLQALKFIPANYQSTNAPFSHLLSWAGIVFPFEASIPRDSVLTHKMVKRSDYISACKFACVTIVNMNVCPHRDNSTSISWPVSHARFILIAIICSCIFLVYVVNIQKLLKDMRLKSERPF